MNLTLSSLLSAGAAVVAIYLIVYVFAYRHSTKRLHRRFNFIKEQFAKVSALKHRLTCELLDVFALDSTLMPKLPDTKSGDWLTFLPATWQTYENLDRHFDEIIVGIVNRNLGASNSSPDGFLSAEPASGKAFIAKLDPLIPPTLTPAPLNRRPASLGILDSEDIKSGVAGDLSIMRSHYKQLLHRILHDTQKPFFYSLLRPFNPISLARARSKRALESVIQMERAHFSPSDRRFVLALIRSKNVQNILDRLESLCYRLAVDQAAMLTEMQNRLRTLKGMGNREKKSA